VKIRIAGRNSIMLGKIEDIAQGIKVERGN